MMPWTAVEPRVGSFALALFGRTRKALDAPFVVFAGRSSLAVKRIPISVGQQ